MESDELIDPETPFLRRTAEGTLTGWRPRYSPTATAAFPRNSEPSRM